MQIEILVFLSVIAVMGILVGTIKNYSYLMYFGFALFFIVGIVLTGEGITTQQVDYKIVKDGSEWDINGFDRIASVRTTANDSSINALALLFVAGGMAGGLYIFTRYLVNNKKGEIEET